MKKAAALNVEGMLVGTVDAMLIIGPILVLTVWILNGHSNAEHSGKMPLTLAPFV
jgi:hypothetical protein